ncbi:hypothetical protein [Moorena sp. SIO3H5]|uniref:hypothetical protein n=1 Tax=Moorena sp. SIO3H5 TaxID=2607834 RepID=UPI0013BCA960|nr:hypothetical protein [Moorena sp. SIO3H5]NEO70571.1 hypothetical protein [Moorena sp. SIO3H5]
MLIILFERHKNSDGNLEVTNWLQMNSTRILGKTTTVESCINRHINPGGLLVDGALTKSFKSSFSLLIAGLVYLSLAI